MVVVKELTNMFWGLSIESGKLYNQIVTTSFHISMAALEVAPNNKSESAGAGQHVSLMLQHDKAEFVLCTLEHGRVLQQALDLNFTEGEEISFSLNGRGSVHLSGYLMPDEDLPEEDSDDDSEDLDYEGDEVIGSDDEDSEESDEEAPEAIPLHGLGSEEDDESDEDSESEALALLTGKRKKSQESGKKKKKKASHAEDSEEESDDLEFEEANESAEDLGASFLNKSQKKKSNGKEDQIANSQAQKSPVASTNGADTETTKKKKKKKKNKKKGNENEANKTDEAVKSPADSKPNKKPKKMVLAGGVTIEELKEGHGPEAKQGKMVGMYYSGTLLNGKQFDSTLSGKPFNFKLGKGEVIKGWDIGIAGMKVGGKRRLIIPPKMGYGAQRTGPIPANATLKFDVELKNVH